MSRRTPSFPLARPARSALVSAAGVALLLGWLAVPASAEDEITIRPETVVQGSPGSTWTVATMPVDPDLVGQPCDLRVTTRNQSSVHPDTNVIVTTGAANTVVEGAENSPDGSVLVTERVTLGTEIVVEVQLGPDGTSSLGFVVGFECSPESLLPVVQPARQTATPTTAPPVTEVPATAAPATEAPATAAPTTEPPGPPTTGAPVVLPARQQAPPLPQTAPAQATPGNPNFTG